MLQRPLIRFFAVALMAALWLPSQGLAQSTPDAPKAPAKAAEPDRPPYVAIDSRKSNHEDGHIKLTVYMDFFCSHCHHFDTVVLPVLQKEYGDKLEVTYIGYPIVDPAASHIPILAYYLAEEQGKAKEMRDALFSVIWDLRMDATRPDILLGVASKVGLDLDQFRAGFNNNTMGERLEAGKRDAKSIGLRGTPTLLIDNKFKVNDNSLRNLESVFAKAIKAEL